MVELNRRDQRATIWPVAAVVGFAFLTLTPPSAVAGMYSIFEASLAILALAMLATRSQAPSNSLPVPTALIALLLLMVASTAWSSASLYTLRDSLSYGALALAAWVLVRRGGVKPIVVGVVVTGTLILLGSIVAWFLDPVGSMQVNRGALTGIYINRNQFGLTMLLCLPAAMAVPLSFRAGYFVRIGLVAAFFAAIVASQSKTSLVAATIVVAAWFVLVLLRRSFRYAIALAAATAVGIVAAAFNWSLVLEFLGKDATLNGRISIWVGLLDLIAAHPVFGSGFLREWPGGSAQSVVLAEKFNGQQLAHAHNEALSWLSGLGVLGLALVLMLYGLAYWFGWKAYRAEGLVVAGWLLLTMLVLNVNGLTSTSETKPQGWFIFMLVLFVSASQASELAHRAVPRWILIGSKNVSGFVETQQGPETSRSRG